MADSVFFTREWPGNAARSLSELGLDVEVWQDYDKPPASELAARIDQGVFALVTTVEDPIGDELLARCDGRLKIIAQAGVGYDNIDVAAAAQCGVWVSNTPGVLDDATADLAFGLMCSAARRLPEADKFVRDGKWTGWHPSMLLGKEIAGATVGVVGLGRIGLAFARRCAGFGMRVLYTANSEKPAAAEIGAEFTSLEKLLRQSDFVSIHVPLNDETRGLIDGDRLEMMRDDAILVNTARGPIVDTLALVRALEAGQIGGAALDVTDPEPIPADHPLLTAPNLVIAPHIGSAGRKTRERMASVATENVVAVSRGERPPNPVGPAPRRV